MSYWGTNTAELKEQLGALGVDFSRHQRESREKAERVIETVKTVWKYRSPIALFLAALAVVLGFKIIFD